MRKACGTGPAANTANSLADTPTRQHTGPSQRSCTASTGPSPGDPAREEDTPGEEQTRCIQAAGRSWAAGPRSDHPLFARFWERRGPQRRHSWAGQAGAARGLKGRPGQWCEPRPPLLVLAVTPSRKVTQEEPREEKATWALRAAGLGVRGKVGTQVCTRWLCPRPKHRQAPAPGLWPDSCSTCRLHRNAGEWKVPSADSSLLLALLVKSPLRI